MRENQHEPKHGCFQTKMRKKKERKSYSLRG